MTGPPPPPPPPPPPAPEVEASESPLDTTGALFAEINALGAAGARAGLKKATKGPVNESAPVEEATPMAPVAAPSKPAAVKAPVCELVGMKWNVEFQVNNKEIEINVDSLKQVVSVYKCEGSVIQVKGKCNSISIYNCKKVDLVFEDALSQIEVVNCDSVRVQCTGKAPSVLIAGCQSVTYFMSQESVADAMIITSRSAAVNVIRPHPDDPNDIVEWPIPEQFCTTFKEGAWVTEPVDHDD